MARTRESELIVTATLRATTGLHVGGLGDDPDVDLHLAVDGEGRHLVPGTSLAGSLRQWSIRAWSDQGELGNDLWGLEDTESDKAGASRIVVDDAPVEAVAERRDGVGIDRVTGAAAEGFKFVRGVLPRGSAVPLRVTVDLTGDPDRRRQAAASLVEALQNGRVRFGGAKSRGLGRLELDPGTLRVEQRSFATWRDTLATLRGRSPLVDLPAEHFPLRDRWLRFEVAWHPVGPVLVKAAADGIAVDTLPQVAGVGGDRLVLVLPGSSVKGAFRSRAERILRTVAGAPLSRSDDFAHQLDHLPLCRQLFGRAPVRARRAGAGASGSPDGDGAGRISALFVDDCYAAAAFTAERWAAVRTARPPDARAVQRSTDVKDFQRERRSSAGPGGVRELRAALDAAGLTRWAQAFHVAVDRWTAAPGDGLLFSVLEPYEVPWEPLRLELDLDRLGVGAGAPEELAAVHLVLVTLRELMAGRIPLGFGVNRGHGAVAVDAVSVSGGGLDGSPLDGLVGARLERSTDLAGLAARGALEAAWRTVAAMQLQGVA